MLSETLALCFVPYASRMVTCIVKNIDTKNLLSQFFNRRNKKGRYVKIQLELRKNWRKSTPVFAHTVMRATILGTLCRTIIKLVRHVSFPPQKFLSGSIAQKIVTQAILAHNIKTQRHNFCHTILHCRVFTTHRYQYTVLTQTVRKCL